MRICRRCGSEHSTRARECPSCREEISMKRRLAASKVVDGLKLCPVCDNWRPLEVFGRTTNGKYWRGTCNPCRYNPEKSREAKLKKNYGVTNEGFEQMWTNQNGLCAICSVGMGRGRKSAVDHCHESDKTRELLCIDCNLSIGRMGDSPERLRAAADYIEKHR